KVDTPYWESLIYVSCEDMALIRRISFLGYGVLIRGALAEQREVIGSMARDFLRFTLWSTSWISQLLDYARVTYTSYSETHIPYQRHVRQRTSEASTSTAQQDPQQPDP
nr:hypothetical protein [Tanacetum cinerariifolium]